MSPSALTLEITERTLLHDGENITESWMAYERSASASRLMTSAPLLRARLPDPFPNRDRQDRPYVHRRDEY